MSNRCVKFVPALFAGVVAATNLATVTDLRAQTTEAATESASPIVLAAAPDSCLSAPKGATPSGGHWYYRIDRATKRQCWYLREEDDKADDKFARAAPPASSPAPSSAAPEPSPPQTRSITSKAIADARAEYISQQGRAAANSPARAEPQTTGTVPAAAAQESARAPMPNVLAPAPLASVRWNDGSGTNPSANPANIQTAAAAPPADQPPPVEEVQQPTAADPVVAPAAAEPATAKPTASLQMLLLVMAAALALAGLTVSAIVRIGRMRARRAMRRKRRAMWDSARTKRSLQPAFHDEDARPRRTGAAHNTRVPQDTRIPQEQRVRAPQERTRSPQERARGGPQPQDWARVPQDRAHAPQERTRVPQERLPQERPRVPQERARVPQDRDQVTEMLARLARSAQN